MMKAYQQHLNHLQKVTEKALATTHHDGLWIYSGHPENHFLDDHAPAYKMNPHFNWWIPETDISHSLLYIVPGKKPTLYLSQPADFWHKVNDYSKADWANAFDVHIIHNQSEMPSFENLFEHAWIGPDCWQPLAKKQTNPKALIDYLHFQRVQKTDYEINCIREANQRALKGHQAAANAFYDGASEYEINMAYLMACQSTQNQMPYGNIVGLNENAAVLHYQYQSIQRHDKNNLRTFLIDAGYNYRGYAADITRTYAFDKNSTFQAMIDVMDEKQRQLCEQSIAGQDYIELHKLTHLKIAEVLQQFKVIKCSPEAAVESGLSSTFFPHGLGHYLGLQVHDVAGHQTDAQGTPKAPPKEHPFLRLTDVLRKNAVITIEPGLYFIPMLLQQIDRHKDVNWEVIKEFLPFGGIRIEDNVVVADGHSLNLTRGQ